MVADSTHTIPTDTPDGFGAAGFQHAWRRAARHDPRMKARHLAVVDAYAEHYYAGKDAMRGVGVADARLAWWSGLSETSIRAARVDLRRWGWLGLVRAHGRGVVARYAFLIPELSTVSPVIPKDARIGRVKPERQESKDARIGRVKAVKAPESGDIPLPSPYLPTSRAQRTGPAASPTDEAGRTTTRKSAPRPAARPGVGWDQVAGVLPGEVATDGRTGRSAGVLTSLVGAALVAGWTAEQIRTELHGADVGASAPVGVIVTRLRGLLDRQPPAATVSLPSLDALDRAALDTGALCEHGNPDRRLASGVHRCPNCRHAQKVAAGA